MSARTTTRVGRVEVDGPALRSPLANEPCALYVVELLDAKNDLLLARERRSIEMTVAPSGGVTGRAAWLEPSRARVEGFVHFELQCSVAAAPPRVAAFMAQAGIRLAPTRRIVAIERTVRVGDLVRVTGELVRSGPPSVEPYRTPAGTGDAFGELGLALVDENWRRRWARLSALAACALAATTFGLAWWVFGTRPNEYRGQEDCPPGTMFQSDYDSSDLCANGHLSRQDARARHGATVTNKGGTCRGKDRVYYAPSEESP